MEIGDPPFNKPGTLKKKKKLGKTQRQRREEKEQRILQNPLSFNTEINTHKANTRIEAQLVTHMLPCSFVFQFLLGK